MAQSGKLRLQMALGPVEVVRDAAQALLEPALGASELIRERLPGAALPLREGDAPLLREATLLGGEHRCGLGALAREHAPDLLDVGCRLLGDRLAHGRASFGDEPRRLDRGRARAAQRKPQHCHEQQRRRQRCGEDPDGHVLQGRGSPLGAQRDEDGRDEDGRGREQSQGVLRWPHE